MEKRVVEVRSRGMWRRIAVSETDEQIHAKIDHLYEAAKTDRSADILLDVWLAIEHELCPYLVRHA